MTPEVRVIDPVRAPLDGNQSPAVLATDGDQFWVFWKNVHGINVARVAGDGRLLSSRLALPGTVGDGLNATWTGSAYLVTWRDSPRAALFVATFSPAGDLLSGPNAVVGGIVQTRTGALASNGHRTLLLYTEAASVRAAIFDNDGNVLRTNIPIPVSGIATNFADIVPVIASDGEEFAIVWRTGALVPITSGVTAQSTPPPLSVLVHDFHFMRVGEDGAVIGPQIDIGRTDQTADFGLAFGNGRYAIVATQAHLIKPGYVQPRLARFSVDAGRGSVTRLPEIDIGGGNAYVFWSGSTFVAYWINSSTTLFAVSTVPFSGADETVAPTPLISLRGNPASFSVSMLSNRRHAFAAWNQNTGDVSGAGSEIYGSLFDTSASIRSTDDAPTLLSLGWSRQFLPSMASSPTGSLLVWIEERFSGRQLMGMRTDVAGAFVDVVPFEIASDVSQAAVVFAGDAYLVAWQEASSRTVNARSIGGDASLGPRISLGPGWSVVAASNGDCALVVFSGSSHLLGYRFDGLGRQIDSSPLVISDGRLPQVASNGTDFFVAWNEGSDYWQFPSANMLDVIGKRISATGAIDDAALPIATGPDDQLLTAIASDGRDYLVAYQVDPYWRAPIETKVVLREGQLGDTTATAEGTIISRAATYGSSLSGDKAGYWIAYPQSDGLGNILRLDQHGKPASPALVIGPAWSSATLGYLPGGAARIVYARPVNDGAFVGTSLIFFRSIGDDLARRPRAIHR